MTKIHPRPEISRPLASTLVQVSDTGEPEPDSSASSQQAPPAPAATEVPQRGPQNDRTDVKQRLLSLLFPRRCPVCEDIVTPRGELICPDCERQLHFLSEPTCQICGREILSEEEELCENCKRHRFLFVRSLALLGYNDVAARSISRIKYTGAREFLDYYGRAAAVRCGAQIQRMAVDALVPVPVHASRRRKRGYNQAEVLAEVMGRELGIPVYSAALLRNKKTAASKELNAAERLKNLMSAFYAGTIPVDLHRVLLVDDIFTTGATMEACTRVLLQAGVQEVYCFALAIRSER